MERFKILMSTDYSESVMNAEKFATAIAKTMNAELVFMHVYQHHLPKPGSPLESSMYEKDLREMNLRQLEDHTRKMAEAMKESAWPYTCIVRNGNVSKEVIGYAEEHNIDMIITGTHGHKGIRDYLLGTNTWNIVRRSRVPVLAVPEDALFTGLRNMAFASDCRQGELSVIKYLAGLAGRFDASLAVIHVNDELLSEGYESGLFIEFKAKVQKEVVYPKLKFVLSEESDNIPEELNSYCLDHQVDCLVMSPVKTFLLERLLVHHSVSRDMLLATKVPFLCVPERPDYPASAFYLKLLDIEKFISEKS